MSILTFFFVFFFSGVFIGILGGTPDKRTCLLVSVGKRLVSVMLTSFSGKYMHFQYKMLYGKR